MIKSFNTHEHDYMDVPSDHKKIKYKQMKQLNYTGRIVGILFLTLMIAYTAGITLIDPILNTSHFPGEIDDEKKGFL